MRHTTLREAPRAGSHCTSVALPARGVSADSIGHASARDAARRRSRGWSCSGCAWRTEDGLPWLLGSGNFAGSVSSMFARRRMSAVHFVHGTMSLFFADCSGRVTRVSRNVRLRHPCPHARGSVDSGRAERRRGACAHQRARRRRQGDWLVHGRGARAGRTVSAVARGASGVRFSRRRGRCCSTSSSRSASAAAASARR